jgi:Mg2+ and Co2+ transporter CorA
MTDKEIALVRATLRKMRRDAHPADKIANQLIKKYERLLREELARRARQSQDDAAA